MIVKKVAQIGNPVIRAKAKKAGGIGPAERKVIRDLADSMRAHGLVGMAAPQIGKSVRIFVTEIRKTKYRKHPSELDPLRVFVNPRIIASSKKQMKEREGCGSVAESGLFGKPARAASITVEALDEHGEPFQLVTGGLLAQIIQHEIDHLDGILFVDRADPKTLMSRSEYLRMKDRD